MRGQLIILLFFTVFSFQPMVSADLNPTIEKLDLLADEALQLTRSENYVEAIGALEEYAKLFSGQAVIDRPFTMDELRVLSSAHHEALLGLKRVNMSKSDRVNRVIALRLATDAIHAQHQPLWHEMESAIIKAYEEVENAVLEGNGNAYNKSLNNFLSIYAIIQPSLKITLTAEELQKIDSKITFLDRYRTNYKDPNWSKELEQIKADLINLFHNKQKDELDPSIWWVIITTGSIIISTLSYVGWKKYKAEKRHFHRKDVND